MMATAGLIRAIAAPTSRASRAGDPAAGRTLSVMNVNERVRSCCASGTYIVAGTTSRTVRYAASATTPTTSIHGGASPGAWEGLRTRDPTAVRPCRNLRTNVSLTIVTGTAVT